MKSNTKLALKHLKQVVDTELPVDDSDFSPDMARNCLKFLILSVEACILLIESDNTKASSDRA